jgi:hypothetical protein
MRAENQILTIPAWMIALTASEQPDHVCNQGSGDLP